MKAYYQEENITIYNGDCLEVMEQFPDKYFDLCLTDPPYGIGIDKMNFTLSGAKKIGKAIRTDYRGKAGWDTRPTIKYFNEIIRVSKNQVIFGGNYFADILPVSNCWIVWDKRVEDKYSNDFADCELLWTSFSKPAKIIRFLWSGLMQGNMKLKEKRVHPTQKPIFVIKKLLEIFTTKDAVVLDPFMGSGSTLRACKDLGRKCIGIELSKEYCDIAVKRLAQEVLPL